VSSAAAKVQDDNLSELTISELITRYPFVDSFFEEEGLPDISDEPDWTLSQSLAQHLRTNPDLADGWSEGLLERLEAFIEQMLAFVSPDEDPIHVVTIQGGNNKDGEPEAVRELEVKAGEVLCIVGPTGSGKSRLLADIEWVAQGDTPTSRRVLLNGEKPEAKWRFSTEHKLVAQLSQNMNFVMDLSVQDFVKLHAESRNVEDPDAAVQEVYDAAIGLAGEPFTIDSPVTSLSGGQSRALMIADVAILSSSPIVLIDEIENAGIDRRKALDVLLKKDKIVLMATHDPILALLGDRRLVINNGGMHKLITPTEKERENLEGLRALDAKLMGLRQRLRLGELLEEI